MFCRHFSISTDHTGRWVTGISPKCVPRTLRSNKSGSKELHLDATIENTESMTLASSTEPLPDLSKTSLLSKKTRQSPSSSDAIQSMPSSVENGSHQSGGSSCHCLPKQSLRKTLCRKQGWRTRNVCSVENLQNKLITALRALQLEHKSHEELEQARDAAESRLRSLTLKVAGMKAVGEVDETFGELLNSTEINQLTLLRTEIAESKLEEQKLESKTEIAHLIDRLKSVDEEKKKVIKLFT
ncbi:hypothetical protein AHF37_08998 [Paragonimus kellicotti]|nr:hypothetical protein AHF37_08998 [Paragonimus kellicotti]